jgi:hypothetical protein
LKAACLAGEVAHEDGRGEWMDISCQEWVIKTAPALLMDTSIQARIAARRLRLSSSGHSA